MDQKLDSPQKTSPSQFCSARQIAVVDVRRTTGTRGIPTLHLGRIHYIA